MQEIVGRTMLPLFLVIPNFSVRSPLPAHAWRGVGFRGEVGDEEIHITVDSVQCGDDSHTIRSPESKGGPENMISPNVEKGFGISEGIESTEP